MVAGVSTLEVKNGIPIWHHEPDVVTEPALSVTSERPPRRSHTRRTILGETRPEQRQTGQEFASFFNDTSRDSPPPRFCQRHSPPLFRADHRGKGSDQVIEFGSDDSYSGATGSFSGLNMQEPSRVRENIRSGRTALGVGVYWSDRVPVVEIPTTRFDRRNDPINAALGLTSHYPSPNENWCCHACGGWWWRRDCGYDTSKTWETENNPPEGTFYDVHVVRVCSHCRGRIGVHADRFGNPTDISFAGQETFEEKLWVYHGGELSRIAEGIFLSRPTPLWPGGPSPPGIQILQEPRHLCGMRQAYEGAPETTFLVTPTPMGGEVYSVMRIIRSPGGPPTRRIAAPGPNPFVFALGTRQQFFQDMAAGSLEEIPFFCEACHGFWWPEFHPYAQARLQNESTLSPLVQGFECAACHGIWEREAIVQSQSRIWRFSGRQLIGRYFWTFLGAELVHDSRYPGG